MSQPTPTIIHRAGTVDTEATREAPQGTTVFLASDDGMDRYRTRIVQDWLDDGRIANFDANPVVPWDHDYSAPPIGRVTSREVREAGPGRRALYVGIEWDTDDPMGATIAGKYARGILSAVSVGFRSRQQVRLSQLDKGHPWRASGDDDGLMLAQNELMEVSALTMPGNPRALAQREARWLELSIIESAPEGLRAELRRILAEDTEIRAIVRQIQGDLHDEGTRAAVPALAEHLSDVGRIEHPWSWLHGR